MPGYSLKVKGDYPRLESSLCPCCNKILKDAIQTEQGYRLCLSCYDDIQKDPNILKRVEDLEIEPNEPYHPDKAVRREVNKIPVYCENCELGCEWSGTLGNHEKDHKQVCQYKSEDCPNGCGQRLLLDKMDSHKMHECLLRDVDCEYCHMIFKAKDREKHLSGCSLAPFTCDSCGESISRTQKDDHMLLNCREALSCSGCGQKVQLSDIDSHLKNSSKIFLHQQQLGLEMKLTEREVNKNFDEIFQKINKDTSGSEEIQEIKKDLVALRGELEEKYSSETERIVRNLDKRVKDLEATCDKQDAEIKRLKSRPQGATTGGFSGGTGSLDDYDRVGQLESKIAETDRQLAVLKVNISELELQLQASLASTYNGSFLWRIPDIKRRRRDALEGKITSIYSPPFYTGRNGYKMCVRAYLNGDGIGYNTHLSIFFVLMKGEYDPLLKWPFDYKVSLILVDQDHRRHIVQTFKPSPSSSSFQKPKSDMNIASGCPKFAELKVLDNESYIKEDIMFIKCIVDTQRIYHP